MREFWDGFLEALPPRPSIEEIGFGCGVIVSILFILGFLLSAGFILKALFAGVP